MTFYEFVKKNFLKHAFNKEKVMKRTVIIVSIPLFILFSFFVKKSYSMEGRLTEFTINKNQVEASIILEKCFNYDLEDVILNGIPIKFLFDIKLYCQSRCWFDQEISSLKINQVIRYDNLKDVFTIHYSHKDKPPAVVDDLVEAESLVSSVNDLKIVTQKTLNPEKDYYITYKVEIKTDTESSRFPFYLDYLLKIFPWWSKKSE